MKKCLLCGSTDLHIFENIPSFHGITSDCKPWPRAGRFMLCRNCGLAQKELSQQWLEDIGRIYSDYEMYPLSDGNEPLIFAEDGSAKPRSGVLLDNLIPAFDLNRTGRILDVGCGNGSLLKQFHLRRPEWQLFGHEQEGRKEDILSLPGTVDFNSGDIGKIENSFDLIIMTYVIEHLTDPIKVLRQLADLLRPGGHIVIHTSSFESNPFDLMVCDHCSHFTPQTLSFLAARSGLKQTGVTDPWLAKEIGVITTAGIPRKVPAYDGKYLQTMSESLLWLEQLALQANETAETSTVGIFGTAVAGTWLAATLEGKAAFFVDEDISKQGGKYMDIPVISPENVPEGSVVIMAFMHRLALKIVNRLQSRYPKITFLIPGN